jgi:hypothetical protein
VTLVRRGATSTFLLMKGSTPQAAPQNAIKLLR